MYWWAIGPQGSRAIAVVRASLWVLPLGNRLGRMATRQPASEEVPLSRRQFLAPLALAQFICSFAGSNMNVMINDITEDLDTTVTGVQATITLFLLVMAVLMIPCSKLTDRWGRKRCFTIGLILYGIGALLSAIAPGLGVLIIGNSILEGVGTALLIPPVYILTTLLLQRPHVARPGVRRDQWHGRHRRRRGAADRRLITTRDQLARGVRLPGARRRGDRRAEPAHRGSAAGRSRPPLRRASARCCRRSACSSSSSGILAADNDLALMASCSRAAPPSWSGSSCTCAPASAPGEGAAVDRLFRNRASNLGLVTQNVQWLMLMGVSFTVAVFLQTVRDYDAVQTGVIFTAATLGILASSLGAGRFAKRRAQRTLIIAGFVTTIAGILLLLALVGASSRVVAFAPGLLVIGLGVGVMLTPSVNLVQSSFAEEKQGEISGLSRSVSNLGSSFGTAIAGTILVVGSRVGNTSYVVAMVVLAAIGLVGLLAALRLPRGSVPAAPLR